MIGQVFPNKPSSNILMHTGIPRDPIDQFAGGIYMYYRSKHEHMHHMSCYIEINIYIYKAYIMYIHTVEYTDNI